MHDIDRLAEDPGIVAAAQDGQFLAGEERHRQANLLQGDTRDHDPSGIGNHIHGGADHRGCAGRVHHDRCTVTIRPIHHGVGPIGGQSDPFGPEGARQFQARRQAVHHEAPGTTVDGGDHRRLANRAGAEDCDGVTRANLTPRDHLHANRKRLNESRQFGIKGSHRKEVCHRDRQVFGKRAGGMDPEDAQTGATVRTGMAARVARAAGEQRFHGHTVADPNRAAVTGTEASHDGGELVPLDGWVLGVWIVPVVEVQVRPTDSRHFDLEECLTGTGVRIRDILDLHVRRGGSDSSLHRFSPWRDS